MLTRYFEGAKQARSCTVYRIDLCFALMLPHVPFYSSLAVQSPCFSKDMRTPAKRPRNCRYLNALAFVCL